MSETIDQLKAAAFDADVQIKVWQKRYMELTQEILKQQEDSKKEKPTNPAKRADADIPATL